MLEGAFLRLLLLMVVGGCDCIHPGIHLRLFEGLSS